MVELRFQVGVADQLGGGAQLAQQLLQAPHAPDDAALKDRRGHLAHISEFRASAPGLHQRHQVRFERRHVLGRVQLQLALVRYFCNAFRVVAKRSQRRSKRLFQVQVLVTLTAFHIRRRFLQTYP